MSTILIFSKINQKGSKLASTILVLNTSFYFEPAMTFARKQLENGPGTYNEEGDCSFQMKISIVILSVFYIWVFTLNNEDFTDTLDTNNGVKNSTIA